VASVWAASTPIDRFAACMTGIRYVSTLAISAVLFRPTDRSGA
jgi:hypothetical protein